MRRLGGDDISDIVESERFTIRPMIGSILLDKNTITEFEFILKQPKFVFVKILPLSSFA